MQRLEEMGGVEFIFLSHRDDVADASRFADHFKSKRIIDLLDRLSQLGMSNVNPLDQPKAKSENPKPTVSPVKTLKAKPAAKAIALKRMPGVKATQRARSPHIEAYSFV